MRKFFAVIVLVFGAVGLVACGTSAGGGGADGSGKPPAYIVAADGALVIDVVDISRSASFIPVSVDGRYMEVIALKAADGSVRTAFNTCQVCYDSGRGYYEQVENDLVCQNCGNRFAADEVGVIAGGCNPVPILPDDRIETADTVELSYTLLKESSAVFADGKAS